MGPLNSNPWLVGTPNPAATRRLFCFPFAGGGATAFRGWQAGLPDVEVVALQLPGRERRLREEPLRSVDELVPRLDEAIAGLVDLPFAFYGHSMGAVAAFELARRLRQQSLPMPQHLFLAARGAPQLERKAPPYDELSDLEFVDEINRRYGGIPVAILREPELMKLFLPAIRADFSILESYKYVEGPPLDCPITAFGGALDKEIKTAAIQGWQQQTTGPFVFHEIPGDHFFLHTYRDQLLETVRALW